MKKHRYKVFRSVSAKKLTGFLDSLFRRRPADHYVVKIVEKEFPLEEFIMLLEKFKNKIEWYRKEKSIVFVLNEYDPDEIPGWLPVAPSELEASDIIDFEEIERDLEF